MRRPHMDVGGTEILLPTTMVGNYPNPRWYDGYAHSKLPVGALVYDSLTREAYEDAVLAIVHDQEAAGLDIISDGRVHGGDSPYAQVVYHYYERMRGYEVDGPQLGLPIYSTLFAATVTGPVSRRTSFAMPTLRAVRKATRKPVKVSYQGIHVLAAASNDLLRDLDRLPGRFAHRAQRRHSEGGAPRYRASHGRGEQGRVDRQAKLRAVHLVPAHPLVVVVD